MFFCVAVGLWGGLIIGLVTEYFTSNRFTPVQVSMLRWQALERAAAAPWGGVLLGRWGAGVALGSGGRQQRRGGGRECAVRWRG